MRSERRRVYTVFSSFKAFNWAEKCLFGEVCVTICVNQMLVSPREGPCVYNECVFVAFIVHIIYDCVYTGFVQNSSRGFQTEEAQSRPGLFHLTAAGVLL